VESHRNKQECKYIAAEYQQRNEKTRVCIQGPKLDTFVKSLAFSKLSFKKAQVRPLSFKSCRFWLGQKLGPLCCLYMYIRTGTYCSVAEHNINCISGAQSCIIIVAFTVHNLATFHHTLTVPFIDMATRFFTCLFNEALKALICPV